MFYILVQNKILNRRKLLLTTLWLYLHTDVIPADAGTSFLRRQEPEED